MELLNAHIINFGKLHEKHFNFSEGINSFLYENGWGKTTLSVFIKSMFYGMDSKNLKDVNKNERLKYNPWQGGIYGGSLSFSHNNRQYQIKRTFGAKKSDDTFELIDLKTNKKSQDFSSDLGNELFGINRETYGRSVYVTLSETPAGSTDISAKLNNLLEAGDVSNYDEAIKNLDTKATSIKAKRGKNDIVSTLQERIDSDRSSIEEIRSKIEQNTNYSKLIEQIDLNINELKRQQDLITQELSKSAKYEGKIRYEQLKDDLEKKISEKKDILEFFNGNIPSSGTMANIDTLSSELATIESNIENQSATQSELDDYEALKSYFAGDIPSQDEINACLKLDLEYKNFKQNENSLKLTPEEEKDFNHLKIVYDNSNLSEEIILTKFNEIEAVNNKQRDLDNLKNELSGKQNELSILQAIKPKNIKRIIGFILSILFLISGIIGFALHNIFMGVTCFVGVIVFLLFGLISKPKKNDLSAKEAEIDELKNKISSMQEEIQTKQKELQLFIAKFNSSGLSELMALTTIKTEFNDYNRLLKKYSTYKNWLSEQSKSPDEYETEIRMFSKRYCKTENISSITTDIQTLNQKLAKFESLKRKINTDSNNKNAQAEKKEKLFDILNQYKTDKSLNHQKQVLQIHDNITKINNIEVQISEAKQAVSDFESDPNNDIGSFAELFKPEKTVEELQSDLSNVSDDITEKNKLISNYQKIIDDNLTIIDKQDDIETEIESLKEKMVQAIEEYKLLLKTSELLKKAKENLDANYSDPMKNGFDKYIKMLEGTDVGQKFLINTDLEVSVDESGKTHESIYLSEGYKDMINFCSRMALVDALFTDVKPPVILDDPFVNLDDDKVPRALQLVKEMSKENQVLYFACHKSRGI